MIQSNRRTHVGSVVVPTSDDCVTGCETQGLQAAVRVAVGVGSRSRSGGDGTNEGDGGGRDGDGELHVVVRGWKVEGRELR